MISGRRLGPPERPFNNSYPGALGEKGYPTADRSGRSIRCIRPIAVPKVLGAGTGSQRRLTLTTAFWPTAYPPSLRSPQSQRS